MITSGPFNQTDSLVKACALKSDGGGVGLVIGRFLETLVCTQSQTVLITKVVY